jgi:hypothetical protein
VPGLLEPGEPEPLPADLGLMTSGTGRYVHAARDPTAERSTRAPAERRRLASERARPRRRGGGAQRDARPSRRRAPTSASAQQPVESVHAPIPAPVAAAVPVPGPATPPAPEPPAPEPPPSQPPAELEPVEPPSHPDPPPDQQTHGPSQFGFEQ